MAIFYTNSKNFNDHISKTKNRKNLKIDFSFVSAHCAYFMQIWLFVSEGEGVCITLTRNSPRFGTNKKSNSFPRREVNYKHNHMPFNSARNRNQFLHDIHRKKMISAS